MGVQETELYESGVSSNKEKTIVSFSNSGNTWVKT